MQIVPCIRRKMALKNLQILVKKQPNRWLVFSSLAFQIGIIMYASIQLGNFLDEKFSTTSFALISSVLGLVMVLWLIYRQSKRFWNNP